MIANAEDFTTDAERWSYRKGARFVGPEEWLHGLPQEWTRDSLHMDAYTEAMAAAADDAGTIIDFRPNEWYEGALSDVMRDSSDDAGWTLKYDRFVAMVLLDIDMMLSDAGYVAGRGNGDSKDRRLTLPPTPTNYLYDPRCNRDKPIPGAGCARDMNTCRYPECTFPEAAPAVSRG